MVIRAFSPPRQKAVARTIRRRSGQRAYQLSSDRAKFPTTDVSERQYARRRGQGSRCSRPAQAGTWHRGSARQRGGPQGDRRGRHRNPLLSRAQILTTDITTAMLDRYTEEALIRISTSSLILMDDKGPAEFISNGLGLLSEHLQWSASERFGGLLATIKLSGVRLPRPCPPQWLVKPRTPADHNNDEPEMVLDEVPLHENGAGTGSSVSSSSTSMGGEVDKSWQIPENVLALLPLQLCVTTSAEQAAEHLPSHGEGNPLRPVTSAPPPSYKDSLGRWPPSGNPSSSRRCITTRCWRASMRFQQYRTPRRNKSVQCTSSTR